jgi:hypothetical protein
MQLGVVTAILDRRKIEVCISRKPLESNFAFNSSACTVPALKNRIEHSTPTRWKIYRCDITAIQMCAFDSFIAGVGIPADFTLTVVSIVIEPYGVCGGANSDKSGKHNEAKLENIMLTL